MNNITIQFIPCSPTPENGYNVQWRVAGSGDPYTDEGNFSSSPAEFIDSINPPGTCYEGFIQSDCGSGLGLGQMIPWLTPCESGGTTYTLELMEGPCGISSNYLIEGGTIGDVVTVRAQFGGMMAKTGNNFVRADMVIFSSDGTSDTTQSGCYSDSDPHYFSITADTVITMTGPTAVVTLTALVNNSSESATSVVVTIIDVNGTEHNIFTFGCRGNSSTGGDC